MNSQPKHKKIQVNTSSNSAVVKPWRADIAHIQKVNSEVQIKKIQQYQEKINLIYKLLANHEITKNDVIEYLDELTITVTSEFKKVLSNMQYNEVPFADFVLSLTKVLLLYALYIYYALLYFTSFYFILLLWCDKIFHIIYVLFFYPH